MPRANAGYHVFAMNSYLASMGMWWCNLCMPDAPVYVYNNYTPLTRPPPPEGPKQQRSPFDICGKMCMGCLRCGNAVMSVHERLIRNMYVSLSGYKACHGSVCLGPCCEGCPYKTLPQRLAAWGSAADAAAQAKTQQFYLHNYKCSSFAEYEARRLGELGVGGAPAAQTMARPAAAVPTSAAAAPGEMIDVDLESGKPSATAPSAAAAAGTGTDADAGAKAQARTQQPSAYAEPARDAQMAMPVVYAYPVNN